MKKTILLSIILLLIALPVYARHHHRYTSTPTPTPIPVPIPAPSTSVWGAYVDGSLSSFETLVGKQVGYQAIFVGWNASFPTSNRNLLVFWEQYNVTLKSIIAGNSDAYIKSFATKAKAFNGQVILAPFHEMNGDWSPWDGAHNSAQDIILAFRKIHDTVGDAPNIKLAWVVNNDPQDFNKYYPGDAYIDIVGVDGFNGYGVWTNTWETWNQTFPSSLWTLLKSHNKPLWITSTASCQGTQKAQWITDMGAGIKTYNVQGWVWFNANKECDWRVNSDTNSLTAFKSIIW